MRFLKNKSTSFIVKIICNLAVSSIFIWLLVRYRDEVVHGISNVRPEWALFGGGFYVLNYVFRVSRMSELANIRKPSIEFVYLVFFHGFATYMLPLQSGDLFLPFILKHTSKKSFKEGVAILLLLRVLDIFAIGILISVSIIFLNVRVSFLVLVIWAVTGIIMLLLPLLIKHYGSFLKRVLSVADFFVVYIALSFDNARGILRSFLVWVCIIGCIYCSIKATGTDIGFSEVVFLTSIQLPFQVIPVQGIANTGVHEGSWVLALTLLGFSSKEALMISLTTHALIISYVILIGLTGLLLYLTNTLFSCCKKSA